MRKFKIQDEKKEYTFKVEIERQDYELLKDYEYCFEANIEQLLHKDAKVLIDVIKNYERIRENE